MAKRTAGDSGQAALTALRCTGVLCLLLLASACAQMGTGRADLTKIAPLQTAHGPVAVAAAAALAPTPDLLATDAAMRDFVHRYTAGLPRERQRLHMLHRAVKSPAVLDMRYDPLAEGSAVETFHRGTANCLSFASMFIALAREAKLDASYQWLEVRPQWSRMGERVAVRLHVNVLVDTRGGGQYMVDIDPLQTRDVAASRRISDNDAQALYHNNIAMEALADNQVEQAWLQLVRALQLSPHMPMLWVNLGAVYRISDQYREAESSYLQALALDPEDRSAMTNLVVLYDLQERVAERDQWARRVERYRNANPYYHAWLGEQAAEENDWRTALAHFERALKLSPDESHLLYITGLAHYQMQEYAAASDYINRAIERATLVSDRESYRAQLEAVKQEQLAGI